MGKTQFRGLCLLPLSRALGQLSKYEIKKGGHISFWGSHFKLHLCLEFIPGWWAWSLPWRWRCLAGTTTSGTSTKSAYSTGVGELESPPPSSEESCLLVVHVSKKIDCLAWLLIISTLIKTNCPCKGFLVTAYLDIQNSQKKNSFFFLRYLMVI